MPDDDDDDEDEVEGETQLVNDATSCLNIFSSEYEKILRNKKCLQIAQCNCKCSLIATSVLID